MQQIPRRFGAYAILLDLLSGMLSPQPREPTAQQMNGVAQGIQTLPKRGIQAVTAVGCRHMTRAAVEFGHHTQYPLVRNLLLFVGVIAADDVDIFFDGNDAVQHIFSVRATVQRQIPATKTVCSHGLDDDAILSVAQHRSHTDPDCGADIKAVL